MVDLNIDIHRPYPNIFAACELHGPMGDYRFMINYDRLSDSFILTRVVSNCCYLLDEMTELVLGHSLVGSL